MRIDHRAFALLALLAFAPLPVVAQQQPQSREAPALPDWDHLTPAQRELLIAPTRDRWNREPERRQRFLERAQRWQSMAPDERRRARRGMRRWETMTPEQRTQTRALFHHVHGMSDAERQAFMQQWRQMTPQQRSTWAKAHPAPERGAPRRDASAD